MRSDNSGMIGLHNFYPLVLAPAFPEIAQCSLSCGKIWVSHLERRSYASFINYIDRTFSPLNSMFRSILPVCTFWYFKCRCSRASQSTVLRVMIMCGFLQVKFCLPLFTLRIFFTILVFHTPHSTNSFPERGCALHTFQRTLFNSKNTSDTVEPLYHGH